MINILLYYTKTLMAITQPVDILMYMPTQANVFTIRLTPFSYYSTDDITNVFTTKTASMSRVLLFKEGGTEHQRLHFHARMETNLKRAGLNKWIDRNFPLLKGKGNRCRSIHVCKLGNLIKDKSLLKSATYIAKEGDLMFSKGYKSNQVKKIIQIGQKLSTDSRLPLYKKVISYTQLIEKHDSFPTEGDLIIIQNAIERFYNETRDMPYPIGRTSKNLMTQILCHNWPEYLKFKKRQEIYNILHPPTEKYF